MHFATRLVTRLNVQVISPIRTVAFPCESGGNVTTIRRLMVRVSVRSPPVTVIVASTHRMICPYTSQGLVGLCVPARDEDSLLVVEPDVRHWVVLAVQRPQPQPGRHGRGGHEGITQLDTMRLRKPCEVGTRLSANLTVQHHLAAGVEERSGQNLDDDIGVEEDAGQLRARRVSRRSRLTYAPVSPRSLRSRHTPATARVVRICSCS